MDSATRLRVRTRLYEGIDEVVTNLVEGDTSGLPYFGNNTVSLMAEAAANVLEAVADAQDYLASEGYMDDSV